MSTQIDQAFEFRSQSRIDDVDTDVTVRLQGIRQAKHDEGGMHVKDGFLKSDRANIKDVPQHDDNEREYGHEEHEYRNRSTQQSVDSLYEPHDMMNQDANPKAVPIMRAVPTQILLLNATNQPFRLSGVRSSRH